MKVRGVLTPLAKPALLRLCRKRDLRVSGTKQEILKRLGYSYHGNLAALVHDLRQEDLLTIMSDYSERVEFPTGLGALPATELRRVCLTVFEERYVARERPHSGAAENSGADEWRPQGPDKRDSGMVLHSTRYDSGLGAAHLDENLLARMASDADTATILSAYYVPDVLKALAGACRGNVRVVLNGLGGSRLNEQAKELISLQETLRKRSQTAEIRLAFAEGLFHTKMYLFGRGDDSVAWIGLANATRAGLNGRNEEVLVRLTPAPPSVLAYVESTWSWAMPVDFCRPTINSLTAFFRTERLYYKPHAMLQMTMNPFRRLMEALPMTEKRKISAFRSDFADDEAGIGAFNLNRAFERMTERESGASPVERRRVELRRFAVETCYGYWVAEPCVGDDDAMLHEASTHKRHRLEAMREWLGNSRDAIVGAYASYLGDVRGMLDEEGVEWHEHAAPNLFEDKNAIEARVDSLLAALGTDRLARHCQAFVASEVPEMWEDAAASASFSRTFFDSLAYAWASRRRSGSAKLILESLEPLLDSLHLSSDPTKEIQRALEDALEEEDWYETNFG